MKLSEEIKTNIINEYNEWFNSLYSNTTEDERKKLGAVFTPPQLTIQMIERLDSINGNILDPCCGAGNLLAGCLIAGADPECVYGNEFESRFVDVARERLAKFGVKKWHIHQGDATLKRCIMYDTFTEDYEFNPDKLDEYHEIENSSKKIEESEKKYKKKGGLFGQLELDLEDFDNKYI